MLSGLEKKSVPARSVLGKGRNYVVVVNRKDGASTFERLQEKDFTAWLENYSVGELWSKNVISGGPVYE